MLFSVLGSGSKGNATYVEGGGVRLLIDAGFSGVEIERRLQRVGAVTADLDGIIITHEHGDHIHGAAVLSRRFKLPVFVSRPTLAAAGKSLTKLYDWQEIAAGTSFNLGALNIHPFSVSHDVADPLGFVLEAGGIKLGYCTDTGITSRLMQYRLSGCHGLILEFNHDPEMLRNSHYPPYLQQRIRSKDGHLANDDALAFLRKILHPELRHVVLAHISESNNHPDIIKELLVPFLAEVNANRACPLTISLAEQEDAGSLVDLS